jgi:hypothetical protein
MAGHFNEHSQKRPDRPKGVVQFCWLGQRYAFFFLSQGDLGGWLVVPLVAVGGGGWPVGVGVGSQNSQASQLNEAS